VKSRFRIILPMIVSVVSTYAFDYDSSWVNRDPNTKSIKSISISSSGAINVIGFCPSGSCSWGSARYDRLSSGLLAVWKHKRLGHKIIAISTINENEIKVISKYLYSGSRSDVTIVDYMIPPNRSSDQLTDKPTLPVATQPTQPTQPPIVANQTVVSQPLRDQNQASVANQSLQSETQAMTSLGSLGTLLGRWSDDDPFNRSIIRIEIYRSNGGIYANIWGRGRCFPKECRWGKHRLNIVDNTFVVRWMQDGIDKSLRIDGLDKDSSGRYRMLRTKITNRMEGMEGVKVRNSYLKRWKQ